MQLIKKKDNRPIQIRTLIVLTGIIGTVFFLSVNGFFNTKEKAVELKKSGLLLPPTCDIRAGFYASPFVITLTSEGDAIYYTLDGSEPTLKSAIYTGPVWISSELPDTDVLSEIPTSPRWKPPLGNVFKGVVVRAITVNKQYSKSSELIRSFFIDERARQRYSFPVVSICVDRSDFFGYHKGIYVMGKSYADKDNYVRKNIPLTLPWWEYPSNYLLHGEDNERKAHIEFFEPNSNEGFETIAGVRINGNATRGYSQKSLRICFRHKYGLPQLDYNIFQIDKPLSYRSLILRNAGNDWDKTMFRDIFMQSLMENSFLDIQQYRPSVVFINGEYWGIHSIQERFEQHYLGNKYKIAADSITILELSGDLVAGQDVSVRDFSGLLDFTKKNDLTIDKNYEKILEQVDIRSFIDFVIANVYFCNADWPNNNVKFWRSDAFSHTSQQHRKWKWMLYDTDWGFNYNALSSPSSNILKKAVSEGSVGILFKALITNKRFKQVFLDRFRYHLNETFNAQSVIRRINSFKEMYRPEMEEHIDRWRAIGSYEQWERNVESLISFANERPYNQAEQLNAFFGLQGTEAIVIKK